MVRIGIVAAVMLGATGVAVAQESPQGAYFYAAIGGGGMGWRENSVQRDGNDVTVEMFMYFDEPQEDVAYQWLFQTVTFNCANNEYTTVEGNYLNRDGTPVMPVSEGMIWPVEDGTVEGLVQAVTCDGANLREAQKAPSRAAAMQALAGS